MSKQDDIKQYLKLMAEISKSTRRTKEVINMGMPITKGKIETAKKIVIYGPEGIGKSTLASQFPDPVFIDTEGSTKELDVARYPVPEYWDMILQEAEDLLEERNFKTLVIDTADWAEKLCQQATCDRMNVKGIEDIGYGKGYVYLCEDFQRLLTACDKLIANGINVVFTAHAMMRKFEQPDELGAYDRWEMKLTKKVAPLLKEWADMVLFCNYKTTVVSDPNTKTKKATGGTRVMYSTHHPCWDAKNRYNLPDVMDMSFEPIASLFEGVEPAPDYRALLREALGGDKELQNKIVAEFKLNPGSTNEDYKKAYESLKEEN